MYKTIRLLAAVVLYLYSCVLTAGEIPPKKFALTVNVTDSISKKPLEAANITIAEVHINAITGADGMVRFDSLPLGSYTVQCSFIGYHQLQQKVWLDNNKTITVELCPEDFHLHEVTVTGHNDELNNLTLQTRAVLEAKQIERTRGLTFADQLKQLSGVNMLSSGPTITKPVIRGMHSNRLVTVNNGVRQEGQQWGADHGAEIDPFSPGKIEVIKGASSVEYGAEAIGGVVKVSPKNFKDTKGINGEFQTIAASNNGLAAGSLLLEGSHFDKHKLSWRTQFTGRKAGDSRTPEYVMSNTGFEETDGSYALHYAYKNFHTEFSQTYFSSTLGILRASHIGNTTDLNNAIASGKPAYIGDFTYGINRPKQDVMHLITAAKLYYSFSTGSKIQLTASRQSNERKEFDRPPRWATSQLYTETPAYFLTLTTDMLEAKFEHAKWHHFKGQLGASVMKQGNYSEGVQPIIPNFIAETKGVYAIEKWTKGRWMLEAGARYDWRDQTIYRLVNRAVVSDDKSFGNFTFSSGLSYLLNEHVKLAGNFSSAWRPPSINELYSYGLHGGTASFETGNDSLKAERSYNAELSVEIKNEKWNVEVSVYRNSISNFIYKEPLPYPTITIRGAFPQFRFVQNDALLQGIDAQVTRKLSRHFNAGLNASYLHAQNVNDNLPLIFMPANRIRLNIGYEKEKLWKLNDVYAGIQNTYVAKQNRFPENIDYIDPPAAYNLIDVNFGFETHIGKQPLRWGFSVYNVLNTSYRDYMSRFRYFSLEPGRNFMVRLAIPFSIYQTKNK